MISLSATRFLVNAEERHRQTPSFEIPSREDRSSVCVGCFAKVIFHNPKHGGGERMWVRVKTVRQNPLVYIGTVDNRPVTPHGPAFGSTVAFGPEHIMDIHRPPPN